MAAVSTFSWLDHRDDDQQRVREALAAFDQPGIIDPLGFGVVRDAFSEMLFPGFSTVQTRARYFLLVPWAYQRLDEEGVAPGDGARRARELETLTIEALLQGSTDREGIIGRYSRAATKQLPSFIYWGGLRRLGIRRFDGPRQEYFATLEQRRRQHPEPSARAARRAAATAAWPGLPSEPPGVFDSATLDLTADEAEFLRDRILLSTRGTYLELLARDGDGEQRADAPWNHPLAAQAPEAIRVQLHHARLFATAAWGAELLYNTELSRLLERDDQAPLPVDYAAHLEEWVSSVEAMREEYTHWDRQQLWALVYLQNPRAGVKGDFVDWWLDLVTAGPSGAVDSADVLRRLREREARIKGARAKLVSRRARERSPSAQGGERMAFRWTQVQRILGDIHEGLAAHA